MKNKSLILILTLLFTFKLSTLEDNKFVIGSHGSNGFFSIFIGVLNKLYWAKINNRTPVVHWDNKCLYFQQGGFNGSRKVWEYYFEPVSHLNFKQGDKVYTKNEAPNGFCIPYWRGGYNRHFHRIIKFEINKVIKQYIKIKEPIKNKIHQFFNFNMLGKKNIGIHLRGTDKIAEAKYVHPSVILQKAKDAARKFKNAQFFVATDEEKLLNLAINFLGRDKVIYYDSHRSSSKQAVHYPRNNGAAILGEEILIEAKLLSKCDVFVHTRSNVATGVMLFNPNIETLYIEN